MSSRLEEVKAELAHYVKLQDAASQRVDLLRDELEIISRKENWDSLMITPDVVPVPTVIVTEDRKEQSQPVLSHANDFAPLSITTIPKGNWSAIQLFNKFGIKYDSIGIIRYYGKYMANVFLATSMTRKNSGFHTRHFPYQIMQLMYPEWDRNTISVKIVEQYLKPALYALEGKGLITDKQVTPSQREYYTTKKGWDKIKEYKNKGQKAFNGYLNRVADRFPYNG